MDDAARAGDRLVMETIVEFVGGVPQADATAESDGRNDDVEIVDEVGIEERSDRGRSSTQPDVEPAGEGCGSDEGFVG